MKPTIETRFVDRYGGFSMKIRLGKRIVYKHEFYFLDEGSAIEKAEEIIEEMGLEYYLQAKNYYRVIPAKGRSFWGKLLSRTPDLIIFQKVGSDQNEGDVFRMVIGSPRDYKELIPAFVNKKYGELETL